MINSDIKLPKVDIPIFINIDMAIIEIIRKILFELVLTLVFKDDCFKENANEDKEAFTLISKF